MKNNYLEEFIITAASAMRPGPKEAVSRLRVSWRVMEGVKLKIEGIKNGFLVSSLVPLSPCASLKYLSLVFTW